MVRIVKLPTDFSPEAMRAAGEAVIGAGHARGAESVLAARMDVTAQS